MKVSTAQRVEQQIIVAIEKLEEMKHYPKMGYDVWLRTRTIEVAKCIEFANWLILQEEKPTPGLSAWAVSK
jgi:hypothetical protein